MHSLYLCGNKEFFAVIFSLLPSVNSICSCAFSASPFLAPFCFSSYLLLKDFLLYPFYNYLFSLIFSWLSSPFSPVSLFVQQLIFFFYIFYLQFFSHFLKHHDKNKQRLTCRQKEKRKKKIKSASSQKTEVKKM